MPSNNTRPPLDNREPLKRQLHRSLQTLRPWTTPVVRTAAEQWVMEHLVQLHRLEQLEQEYRQVQERQFLEDAHGLMTLRYPETPLPLQASWTCQLPPESQMLARDTSTQLKRLATTIGEFKQTLPMDVEGWDLVNPVVAASLNPLPLDLDDPFEGLGDWVGHGAMMVAGALSQSQPNIHFVSAHTQGSQGLLFMRYHQRAIERHALLQAVKSARPPCRLYCYIFSPSTTPDSRQYLDGQYSVQGAGSNRTFSDVLLVADPATPKVCSALVTNPSKTPLTLGAHEVAGLINHADAIRLAVERLRPNPD